MRQLAKANAAAFDPGAVYGTPERAAARPAPAEDYAWGQAPYTPASRAPAPVKARVESDQIAREREAYLLAAKASGARSMPSVAAGAMSDVSYSGGTENPEFPRGGTDTGRAVQEPENAVRFIKTLVVDGGKGVIQGPIALAGDSLRGLGMGTSLIFYGGAEGLGLVPAGTTERSFNYWRDQNYRPFSYEPGLGEAAGLFGELASPAGWVKAATLLYRGEAMLASTARTFGPQIERALDSIPGANLRYNLREDSGGAGSFSIPRTIVVTPEGVAITPEVIAVQGSSRLVGDFRGLHGARVEEIVSRVPQSWALKSQESGPGIRFLDESGLDRIRIHGPDANAPAGLNSASGWTLRVHVPGTKNSYYDNLGNVVGRKANEGHIPIFGNPKAGF